MGAEPSIPAHRREDVKRRAENRAALRCDLVFGLRSGQRTVCVAPDGSVWRALFGDAGLRSARRQHDSLRVRISRWPVSYHLQMGSRKKHLGMADGAERQKREMDFVRESEPQQGSESLAADDLNPRPLLLRNEAKSAVPGHSIGIVDALRSRP